MNIDTIKATIKNLNLLGKNYQQSHYFFHRGKYAEIANNLQKLDFNQITLLLLSDTDKKNIDDIAYELQPLAQLQISFLNKLVNILDQYKKLASSKEFFPKLVTALSPLNINFEKISNIQDIIDGLTLKQTELLTEHPKTYMPLRGKLGLV